MQLDDLRQAATEHIRVEVARGRATCAMIVAGTAEYLHGAGEPADLCDLAWELVPGAFAAHLEAQARWPDRTDSDRLTDAFRALDAAGIVAREDFTCCRSCGVNDIGAEVPDGSPAHGYVFYHEQDAGRAAVGGSLWLAFGMFDQQSSARAGEQIAAALRAEGLQVDWNGSPDQRIQVPLGWARRRHGRLAAFPPDRPVGRTAKVQFLPDQHRVYPPMSVAALASLELPWLADDTAVRVDDGDRTVTIRRERHRLVADDGRVAGRFEGLRLLGEGDPGGAVPDEPGLIEVTFSCLPSGAQQHANRPMDLPEIIDVLRRMPTRTDSWLSAEHDAGCVQMRWENGRLWLETPNPADSSSTGKFASLDEAERMLTILATQNRNAVADLDGVTTKPW